VPLGLWAGRSVAETTSSRCRSVATAGHAKASFVGEVSDVGGPQPWERGGLAHSRRTMCSS
jgi:hypothetical protein